MNITTVCRYVLPLTAGMLLNMATAPVWAVQQYTVTAIPSLPEGGFVEPVELGADGIVVGYNRGPNGNLPIVYQNGSTRQLPKLPSSSGGSVSAVNDAGTLVGTSGAEGVIWSQDTITALPRLSDSTYSYAHTNAINNLGVIAGSSNGRAVLWRDGQLEVLTMPTNAQNALALGINDHGVAVGHYSDSRYQNQALAWHNGSYTLLETPEGYVGSTARRINNQNVIAGRLEAQGNLTQAAIWIDGQAQVLAMLGDTSYSLAYDINDLGQVVGMSSHGGDSVATLWEDGQGYQLLDLVVGAESYWQFYQAMAINSAGQIVTSGYGSAGYGAYLLTPVPEVRTSLLMGVGLLAMLALVRRRSQQKG